MDHLLPNLQFKFLRLIVGLPILALGVATNCDGLWHMGYLIRCFFGLIGAYIITRMMAFELCGIGFFIIGLPVYLHSMSGDAFLWLNAVWDSCGVPIHSDYYPLQISARTLGACCIFAGIKSGKA